MESTKLALLCSSVLKEARVTWSFQCHKHFLNYVWSPRLLSQSATRVSKWSKVFYGGSGPWSIKEYQVFPIFFFLASLCSFICLQAVYQLSGAVCKATWNGYPSYSLLTFISRFVD